MALGIDSVPLFFMYLGGPFFCNPLKPLIQLCIGSPYPRAYRHFRSAHSIPWNVGVHIVCLLLGLMANFALLHEADLVLVEYLQNNVPAQYLQELPPWFLQCGPVAASTAIMWGILLACTSSPLVVRATALALLGAFYNGRAHWGPISSKLGAQLVEGMIFAVCIKWADGKAVPVAPEPPLWFIMICRFGLHALLFRGAAGILTGNALTLTVIVSFVLLAYGCIRPFTKAGWHVNCYWAGYVGWILAILTGQRWMLYYGAGYIASLCQGVAHEQTGEAANLPELALRSGPEKVGDEYAHTVFFPCLILHSAYENLMTWGESPEPAPVLGRVLVTGCAGRIGRAITTHLVKNGVTVRGFDRQTRPQSLLPNASSEAFQYVQGDLGDEAALKRAVEGCETVCHFAAVPDDADFETALCPVNIRGLNRLLEVCRGSEVQRLVVASSGKIFFHRKDNYPIRLEDPPKITCNYGATKLFLEGATEVFANDPTGCPTVVLRLAWLPFAREDVEAMESVIAPGQGRDEYMSPEDCGRCVHAAITADLKSRRFTKLFCQSKPPPGRPYRFDIAPTKKILGWEPRDTFPTGIEDSRNQSDYIKNPDLKKRVVPGEASTEKRRKLA